MSSLAQTSRRSINDHLPLILAVVTIVGLNTANSSNMVESLRNEIENQIESLRNEMENQIESLRQEMNARFESVDQRFESIESRMESGFNALRAEIQQTNDRLNETNDRLYELNGRVARVETGVLGYEPPASPGIALEDDAPPVPDSNAKPDSIADL